MPRVKYETEEQRLEARREQKRKSESARRARQAEEGGREVLPRKKFATEEERKKAVIEREQKKQANRKEKRKKEKKPWTPKFVGLDGESFDTGELLPDGSPKQAYYLLLRSDKEPLFTGKPLSTQECLFYLTGNIPSKTAFVGYFLNFDFEWILKDLEEWEYNALRAGDKITPEDGAGMFQLQWFVGKKLVIHRLKASAFKKPHELREPKDYYMTTFQDSAGFFQSSFVGALNKWGFQDDERLRIIKEGKAARGAFQLEDFEKWNEYNRMEMELLVELMHKVYDSFKQGYESAGLGYAVHSGTWAGPGWFANDFLKQTGWNEEHLPIDPTLGAEFATYKKEFFGNDAALAYPFSLAYYGGRIELAAVGKFTGKSYNYDIKSAYPYALSLLPRWTAKDFELHRNIGNVAEKGAKEFLSRRLMGMYGVRFQFPVDWTWYPFPIRETPGGSPTVFYPSQGETNIMSPELFAVLDTLTPEELRYVSITYAVILKGSDGYGDALSRMPEARLSQTAKKTLTMADVRLQAKAASKRVGTPKEREGDKVLAMAEKALKLILNSLYGKTVQQVGSHKYYNDFASAWITSTCRALLWRAAAPERKTHNLIMTMTDGIYSLVKLPFPEARMTEALGDWDDEKFTYFETFKPGIYRYVDKDGMHFKVRGFLAPTDEDKEKLFELIWASVSRGTIGDFPASQFIPRTLAKTNWKRESYLRQFQKDTKIIESELKTKREPDDVTGWLLPENKENAFFTPKLGYGFRLNQSKGYALDFEAKRLEVEDEDDETRFLAYYDSIIGLEENFY